MRAAAIALVAGLAIVQLRGGPPPGSGRPEPARPRRRCARRPGAPTISAWRSSNSSTTKGPPPLSARRFGSRRISRSPGSTSPSRCSTAATRPTRRRRRGRPRRASPTSPAAHFVLGLASRAEDRLDDAIAAFTRVLQLDPADAGTKIHLGQIQLQQRRYDEALRLFQDALTAEPYNVTAAYNAALALTRAGRAEDGRQAMQRFESLRDSIYGVTYSQTYLAQGRYGEALASTGAEPDLVNPGAAGGDVLQRDRHVPAGSRPRRNLTRRNRPAASRSSTRTTTAISTSSRSARPGRDSSATTAGGCGTRRPASSRFPRQSWPARARSRGTTTTTASPISSSSATAAGGSCTRRQTGRSKMRRLPPGCRRHPPRPPRRRSRMPITTATSTSSIAGAAAQLLRNNGNGTFTDITAAAGIGAEGRAAARAVDCRRRLRQPARHRHPRRRAARSAPALFRNMRDGTFRDAAAELGLPPAAEYSAVTAADVNKDGYTDLFLAKPSGAGVFALSDGHGKFRTAPGPFRVLARQWPHSSPTTTTTGSLDLLMLSGERLQVFRNIGGDRWPETGDAARLPGAAPGAPTARSRRWRSAISTRRRHGRRDPRSARRPAGLEKRRRQPEHVAARAARGARQQSQRHRREDRAARRQPAPGPRNVGVLAGRRAGRSGVRPGLAHGGRRGPRAVAVGHPAGGDDPPRAGRRPAAGDHRHRARSQALVVPVSLHVERHAIRVRDRLHGRRRDGRLGRAGGLEPARSRRVRPHRRRSAPAARRPVRAADHERARGSAVRRSAAARRRPITPRTSTSSRTRACGRRRARRSPSRPSRNARPPVRALDEHGHDVLPQIASLDRRYPDDFGLLPIRGYAAPHELVLDLGAPSNGACSC